MDWTDQGILVGLGLLVQHLRGYPRFGFWATTFSLLAAPAVMVFANHPDALANLGTFAAAYGAHYATMTSALGSAHLIAHASAGKARILNWLLPVYDQFAPAAPPAPTLVGGAH